MKKNKRFLLGKITGLVLIASLISCGNQQEPTQAKTISDNPINAQIVNGDDIWKPHAYPFLVKVGPDGAPCGGAIINTEWVMTAEHCAYGRPRVIAGEHDVKKREGTEQIRQSVKVFQRPGADFAVLKLNRPLTFNQYVQPIALKTPPPYEDFIGKSYLIAGWGMTDPNGESQDSRPNTPKIYLGSVTDRSVCAAVKEEICVKGEIKIVPNKEGDQLKHTQSCHGDSGSPMFDKDEQGRHYAVAVVQSKSHNAKTKCNDGHNLFAPVDKAWVDRIISNN